MKRFLVLLLPYVLYITACNSPNTKTNHEERNTLQKSKGMATVMPDSMMLFDKVWKLMELRGNAILLDSTFQSKPILQLIATDNHAYGNLGCNGFGMKFELRDADGIIFSNIASTELACPNLKIEKAFLEALNRTNRYEIAGKNLLLKDSTGYSLAKFSE